MLGPALAALVVAVVVTFVELVTSRYPRTYFLVARCPWLYAYCAIYGLLAAGIVLLLPSLTDQVRMTGIGLGNPWVQAGAIGIGVKAFFHIRLFDITTGPNRSFPFGIESIVQLFEPWMLRSIELDHFSASTTFLAERAKKHADLAGVRARAQAHIPPSFAAPDRAAMQNDLNAASAPDQVLGVYLAYCGRRPLNTVFPP